MLTLLLAVLLCLWTFGFILALVLLPFCVTMSYFLTICPACAIRDICPGGRFQNIVLKRRE